MPVTQKELDELLLPSYLTEEQRRAITAKGQSLLLCASAGSGKTFVLSTRVAYLLSCLNDPVRADQLLVVTFTRAAAKEMKVRIIALFHKLVAHFPDDITLRRQQLLLERAKIMTIDAFCADLLREHFEKANIQPDFRVADDQEMGQLLDEMLEHILEKNCDEDAEAFGVLCDYFNPKGEQKLKETLLELYHFARKQPFPLDWLKHALPAGGQIPDYRKEIWERMQSDGAEALSLYQKGEAFLSCYPIAQSHLQTYHQKTIAALEDLQHILAQESWDNAKEAVDLFSFPRKPGGKKPEGYEIEAADFEESVYLKPAREQIKALGKRYLFCTQQECEDAILAQRPYLQTLLSLTEELYIAMQTVMREKNLLDFAELGLLALKLLTNHTDHGPVKSALGEALSQGIAEILVDEYQDVNPMQEMLFHAISQNQSNLFMVGDVKQSIYRFRQASPDLFLQKKKDWEMLPLSCSHNVKFENHPAKLILAENFRSRSTVTESVNFLFSQIMSESVGGINYDNTEALKAAAVYPAASSEEYHTELHLIDSQGNDKTEQEADYIAAQISKMCREGFQVGGDDGKMRPCQPGDFAVLLRSAKEKASIFAKRFLMHGLDVWTESTSGYFSSREVSLMRNLLHVIDNPLQDIPMLSILISPIFGFTPDELATLRLADPKASLYLCLLNSESEKAASFLKTLNSLRDAATSLRTDQLIQTIYDKTVALALFGAAESSTQKLANLRLLLHHAKSYEASSRGGLSGFLRYMERVQRTHHDFAAANIFTENAAAVRIMTMHKSKGLEFPIVFVAGCASSFNFRELSRPICIHRQMGLTAKHAIPSRLTRFATQPYIAAQQKEFREMLSEEMRVLYVAMTRAKEKLFLTICDKDPIKLVARTAAQCQNEMLRRQATQKATHFAQWLLLGFLQHPDMASLRDLAQADLAVVTSKCPLRFVYWNDTIPLPIQKSPRKNLQMDESWYQTLKEQLAYRYPHHALCDIPAKLSVTQITKKTSGDLPSLPMPRFDQSTLDAAARGTANHLFFQFADFTKAKASLSEEAARLVRLDFLTKEQAGALDIVGLSAFFSSPLYQQIQKSPRVERELSFLYQMDASTLYPNTKGETLLVQGIADCVFYQEDGIVILDYKTDRASEQQLKERYSPQLQLYRLALEKALGKPVKNCLIYSLHLQDTVRII